MQESDEIIDDLESDLDFDTWEEDGENAKELLSSDSAIEENPPKRKKGRATSLILLLLIAAGAIGAYYYFSGNDSANMPPIIKLDTGASPDGLTDNTVPNIATQDNIAAQTIPTPSDDRKNPILTPLPSDEESANIMLMPLDTYEEEALIADATPSAEDISIQEAEAPIESVEEEPPAVLLQEMELLSKTEENPEAALPVIAQESAEPDVPAETSDSSNSQEIEKKPVIQEPEISQKEKKKPLNQKIPEKSAETKADAMTTPALPNWEIRGANLQRAVLYNKTTKETRTVEPGDTVKGLGRIKAIRKENGKWLVIGTLNKVKQ